MAVSEKELMELELKVKNGIKLTKEEKLIVKENNAEAKAKKSKMSLGQRLQAASKSEYSQLMGDGEVDKFPIRDWISTGNYLLNAQISSDPYKGMPSGRVMMLAGPASCGKSFLALETAKNAQDLGYFVILYDSEMANNDKEALKSRGINTENLLYIPIDTIESLKTSLLNIVDEVEDEKIFIIVDSIGNLSTKKEVEDSIEGSTTKDMTRPAQLKALFRTVTLKAGVKNVPIVAINHVYAQIGGFMSGGTVIGGGAGGLYNASIIVEFTKAQEKGADGKMSGALISSTVSKCRTAKERTKVKFTIDFEDGLTKTSGLALFCDEEKIIIKADGRSMKLNPALCSGVTLSVGETFTSAKMDDVFWKELLDKYLADYLRNKFRYQSSTDGIYVEDDE